jgi:hypothetical protein
MAYCYSVWLLYMYLSNFAIFVRIYIYIGSLNFDIYIYRFEKNMNIDCC